MRLSEDNTKRLVYTYQKKLNNFYKSNKTRQIINII